MALRTGHLAQAFEWTVPHVVARGRRTPNGSARSVVAPLERVYCINVSLSLDWLGGRAGRRSTRPSFDRSGPERSKTRLATQIDQGARQDP